MKQIPANIQQSLQLVIDYLYEDALAGYVIHHRAGPRAWTASAGRAPTDDGRRSHRETMGPTKMIWPMLD